MGHGDTVMSDPSRQIWLKEESMAIKNISSDLCAFCTGLPATFRDWERQTVHRQWVIDWFSEQKQPWQL